MNIISVQGKEYQIYRRLSKGVFGRVYECQSADSQEALVVKIIQGQTNDETIQEIKLMKMLQKTGFPQILDWGEGFNGHEMIESVHEPYFQFIVQSKLGLSLKDVVIDQRSPLQVKEVCQIGIQLMTALQELHTLGYIHRDIKPDNILLGLNDRNAHLIDFGQARKFTYLSPSGQLKHKKNFRTLFTGNKFWSSKWVISENTPSRRDDIISTIYSLVFMLNGYNHICSQHDIASFVRDSSAQQFCVGAEAMAPVLAEAYQYTYSEKPDYEKLRSLLQNQINKENEIPIPILDEQSEDQNMQYCSIPEDTDEQIQDIGSQIYFQETCTYNLNHPLFCQSLNK